MKSDSQWVGGANHKGKRQSLKWVSTSQTLKVGRSSNRWNIRIRLCCPVSLVKTKRTTRSPDSMASVHKVTEALAKQRGAPLATIEAYTRVLRREGLLPETKRGGGATPLQPEHVGFIIGAVLRGSPSAAASNAREIGGLIPYDGGALLGPVLQKQLSSLGWAEDITFARAVGWLIEQYRDGNVTNIVAEGSRIEIKVDLYWSMAWFTWIPTKQITEQVVEGWKEAFKDLDEPPVPDRSPEGFFAQPMSITFHSPLLYEQKVSYGVDKERNQRAGREYWEKRKEAGRYDRHGNEWITERTIIALSEVFKD